MKSIMPTEKGTCYICGCNNGCQEHHIFGGPDRDVSERYGLKVWLCPVCHGEVHGKNGQFWQQVLHEKGQVEFEKNHSREDFRFLFRKSYL